jgi:hypothetical protein
MDVPLITCAFEYFSFQSNEGLAHFLVHNFYYLFKNGSIISKGFFKNFYYVSFFIIKIVS